jgi:hypothetical protein
LGVILFQRCILQLEHIGLKYSNIFTNVKEASDQVLPWLEKNHKLLWMRSAFNPAVKCDYITNNLAECFNSWIKDWKDLQFVTLLTKLGRR